MTSVQLTNKGNTNTHGSNITKSKNLYLNLHLPTGIHVWILESPHPLVTHTYTHPPTHTHARTHSPSHTDNGCSGRLHAPSINPWGELRPRERHRERETPRGRDTERERQPSQCGSNNVSRRRGDWSYLSRAQKQRQTQEKIERDVRGRENKWLPYISLNRHTQTHTRIYKHRGWAATDAAAAGLSRLARPLPHTYTHAHTHRVNLLL